PFPPFVLGRVMNVLNGIVGFVWTLWALSLVLAVLAGPVVDEAGLQLFSSLACAVAALHPHRPKCLLAVPAGGKHPVAIADVVHRTGFLSRFFYIAFDIRPVGNGLAPGPGLVRIAEGIHVRIRADTGVAKQIPGTAYCIAPLKDQITLVRTASCQRPGHPYPGQTGTY